MPHKPRRANKPTPSLYNTTKGYVAKNVPIKHIKELKDKVPTEVYKDIKHKRLKKEYDHESKRNSSATANQQRKELFREEYKIRRANYLDDKSNRRHLKTK